MPEPGIQIRTLQPTNEYSEQQIAYANALALFLHYTELVIAEPPAYPEEPNGA